MTSRAHIARAISTIPKSSIKNTPQISAISTIVAPRRTQRIWRRRICAPCAVVEFIEYS
jgi:hypothetical protein